MQSVLTINAVIWVVLAAIVGSLALYRKFVSRTEVDLIHLRDNEARVVSEQVAFAHRLETIDRWGKILTIAVIAYGMAIAALYVYSAWQASVQPIS